MPYQFSPPTRGEGMRVTGRMNVPKRHMARHFITVGVPVTVLIKSGVVTEYQTPTVADVNAADFVFMGGHDTPVSAANKILLEAAGYTVTLV